PGDSGPRHCSACQHRPKGRQRRSLWWRAAEHLWPHLLSCPWVIYARFPFLSNWPTLHFPSPPCRGVSPCVTLIPMFGIGFPGLLLILIIALLVVGPSRLPEVARAIGKALGEFRRMADEVKETIEHELIKEEEKPDESHVSRPEPLENTDAAALHEPTPPHGADASSYP